MRSTRLDARVPVCVDDEGLALETRAIDDRPSAASSPHGWAGGDIDPLNRRVSGPEASGAARHDSCLVCGQRLSCCRQLAPKLAARSAH